MYDYFRNINTVYGKLPYSVTTYSGTIKNLANEFERIIGETQSITDSTFVALSKLTFIGEAQMTSDTVTTFYDSLRLLQENQITIDEISLIRQIIKEVFDQVSTSDTIAPILDYTVRLDDSVATNETTSIFNDVLRRLEDTVNSSDSVFESIEFRELFIDIQSLDDIIEIVITRPDPVRYNRRFNVKINARRLDIEFSEKLLDLISGSQNNRSLDILSQEKTLSVGKTSKKIRIK
jgi:hypothetical protein